MKFTYFKFENFKGIVDETLDLTKNSDSRVFTLVGLNESGKTTVLEAINYFAYKPESLDALGIDDYNVEDVHNLIPINKRDNFNGYISIEAGVELDDDDINEIREELKKNDLHLTDYSKHITYGQEYYFKDSKNEPAKNKRWWNQGFKHRKKRARNDKPLTNDEAQIANDVIKKRMPSILYFPNFLFEFPERIYLDPEIDDSKHHFYQTIIQDILDSLQNNTKIKEHIIERVESSEDIERRNLNSLVGKMEKQLTKVIFSSWNQMFDKEFIRTEVKLYISKDDNGPYIEFNIKDDVDTYRVTERSLGFRWFFVFILLTQFRSFRKGANNAFFLFDEPASNLHPSAQLELLKSFEKLPKVLYTTHSHYLINPTWLENTFVIKNEAIDYNHEEECSLSNTDVRIHRYRTFSNNHPNQTSYFQPILDVLDYRPANLELIPDAIVCEGKSDFYVFNYFQDIIDPKKKKCNFIPGTSASNIETLISLYLGWGRNFIVLLDSDSEGLKQKARYEEQFGLSISERKFTYKDINNKWNNMVVEKLFEKHDQLKIQNIGGGKNTRFNKKTFNRNLQELYVTQKKIQISSDSEEKIKSIITFLKDKLNEGKQ